VFDSRVLNRILRPKKSEVTGECRKLHNDELNNLYSSQNIVRHNKSRMMSWAGHVARMGVERIVYLVLVRMPEGKRPLGRPSRRWEDGIRTNLGEIRLGVWSGFSGLMIGAVVNAAMDLRVLDSRS
jgi:hypothetical protein